MNVVEFDNVSKSYISGRIELPVLNQITFSIQAGQFVVLLGPSGSGKSTLLNLVGGLDNPTNGSVTVCGKEFSQFNDNALTDFRAAHIGFIFQSFNLIPVLTAAENVEYPLLNTDLPAERRQRRVARLLAASILDLMRHIQRSHGISFLVASHDERVMREADVTIHLLDGHIQQIEQTPRSATRSPSSRSRSRPQQPSPSPGVSP